MCGHLGFGRECYWGLTEPQQEDINEEDSIPGKDVIIYHMCIIFIT